MAETGQSELQMVAKFLEWGAAMGITDDWRQGAAMGMMDDWRQGAASRRLHPEREAGDWSANRRAGNRKAYSSPSPADVGQKKSLDIVGRAHVDTERLTHDGSKIEGEGVPLRRLAKEGKREPCVSRMRKDNGEQTKQKEEEALAATSGERQERNLRISSVTGPSGWVPGAESGSGSELGSASPSGAGSGPLHPRGRRKSCIGVKLRIQDFGESGGGRGLAAVRSLRRGELILHVPESVLLSSRTAHRDSVVGPILASAASKLSSHQVLVIHLLHEVSKGKSSTWHIYLSCLPREHHALRHFSPAEAEALQVSSRTLYVPWDEAGALCPVGDLFNYAPPTEQLRDCGRGREETAMAEEDTWSSRDRLTDGGFSVENNAYQFFAREDYAEGEQVYLCYGEHENLDLLEHYGFLLEHNPNDAVRVNLTQQKRGEESAVDSLFLQLPPGHTEGFSDGTGKICLTSDGLPSFSLLRGLRLAHAGRALRKERGHLAASGLPLTPENERAVYTWLRKKCASLLAGLPTSLARDKALWARHCMHREQEVRQQSCGDMLPGITEQSVKSSSRIGSASTQQGTGFTTQLEQLPGGNRISGWESCVMGDHLAPSSDNRHDMSAVPSTVSMSESRQDGRTCGSKVDKFGAVGCGEGAEPCNRPDFCMCQIARGCGISVSSSALGSREEEMNAGGGSCEGGCPVSGRQSAGPDKASVDCNALPDCCSAPQEMQGCSEAPSSEGNAHENGYVGDGKGCVKDDWKSEACSHASSFAVWSVRERLALQWRMGYKRIVHRALATVGELIQRSQEQAALEGGGLSLSAWVASRSQILLDIIWEIEELEEMLVSGLHSSLDWRQVEADLVVCKAHRSCEMDAGRPLMLDGASPVTFAATDRTVLAACTSFPIMNATDMFSFNNRSNNNDFIDNHYCYITNVGSISTNCTCYNYHYFTSTTSHTGIDSPVEGAEAARLARATPVLVGMLLGWPRTGIGWLIGVGLIRGDRSSGWQFSAFCLLLLLF
ncbi:hypothetical protein CBR_g38413 [Chara braunii]|uniref:SET domain-containing protein n=1 Tax=Chara braunii TaxID=69332 RepID=A0A388JNM1_CHABU|nr:hypothetical protein CBR_g38413 [Chara braunii]|eukprot:GBG59387.1 hypothetical protein CBR_g38413 [Chara braunii]